MRNGTDFPCRFFVCKGINIIEKTGERSSPLRDFEKIAVFSFFMKRANAVRPYDVLASITIIVY